jgi:hypothetical protein
LTEKRQHAAVSLHLLVVLNILTLLCGGVARGQSVTTKPAAVPQNEINIRVGADGLPAQIEAKRGPARGILSAPCRLYLKSPEGRIPVPPLHESAPGEWTADWPAQHLQIGIRYRKDPDTNLTLAAQNLAPQTRRIQLELTLPFNSEADHAFFPAGSDPHVVLDSAAPAVAYTYSATRDLHPGITMSLPLTSIYSTQKDWGITLFGDLTAPIPNLVVSADRAQDQTTVTVLFPDLDLEPSASVARRVYLSVTAGDWRPSLAKALTLFPLVFEPRNHDVAELAGPFLYTQGTPSNDVIAELHAQGVRVVEIHFTPPLYGLYVPDREPYTPFCDDKWHFLKQRLPDYLLPRPDATWREIRDFVETYELPTMTVARVRDYIVRLHQHGIKGLIYYNPTEAWAPWAAAEFPEDRVVRSDGKFMPEWYESVKMHADLKRPWGRYILDQLRGELKEFPDVDGVFFDEAAQGSHELYQLCAEGCREVRAQGKICWWNGPYNAELASLADGMMTEGGGQANYRNLTEMIQYYAIAGKPIVSLGPATPEAYSEMLVHGVIPKPVPPEKKEISIRWFPLFAQLRNVRWVLQAHALEVDSGVAANLFQAPNGDYLVPLVPDQGAKSSARTAAGFDVKVRVEGSEDVKAVFLLTPDPPDSRNLPFQKAAGTLTVYVPSLNSAGLLVLSKPGVLATPDPAL